MGKQQRVSKAQTERKQREAAEKAAADLTCSPDLRIAALAADAQYDDEKKKELEELLSDD